jgi:CBS-domain-containing membrane protein
MIMVLNAAQIQHYGWLWAAGALLANATICLLLALAINNLIKLGRYPVLHQVLPTHRDGISEDKLAKEDITWALGKMQGFVDADEEDLLEIYRLAIVHSRGSRLLRNQYRGPA